MRLILTARETRYLRSSRVTGDWENPVCSLTKLSLIILKSGRRYPFTGNQASKCALLALRQNSEAVHGPEKLTHRNPHIQPANACSDTSKRRKESIKSPTNSCQCFCVMDAPEIYQLPGLVVVGEFLTAIQASDVGSSGIGRSASG